jgi:hypothetical protein
VIGGINFVDSASNDTRIDFDRAQYSIAVRWAM